MSWCLILVPLSSAGDCLQSGCRSCSGFFPVEVLLDAFLDCAQCEHDRSADFSVQDGLKEGDRRETP